MTVTVKFPLQLESGLRRYAQARGMTTSGVIREAVAQYLVQAPAAPRSAHDLGADLFGRFGGPPELAAERKQALLQAWDEKHAERAAPRVQPGPGKPSRKPSRQQPAGGQA